LEESIFELWREHLTKSSYVTKNITKNILQKKSNLRKDSFYHTLSHIRKLGSKPCVIGTETDRWNTINSLESYPFSQMRLRRMSMASQTHREGKEAGQLEMLWKQNGDRQIFIDYFTLK